MATPPRRPKRIDQMDRITTVAASAATDLLLVTRRLEAGPPEDWENYSIPTSDFITQLLAAVPAAPTPVTLPSELTLSDNLAIETFEDYDVGALTTLDQGYGWTANGVASGLSIVSRTPFGNGSPSTHKRMSVASGGEYGRTFPWGDNWGSIVICMICRIDGSSTFGPSDFAFGLCSGTSAMFSSASCLNFAGIGGANNGATDATITAGTRMSYFNLNPSTRFKTKRAAVVTDRTAGTGSNVARIPSTEGFLAAVMVQCDRPTFLTDSTSVTYSWATMNTTGGREEFPVAKRNIFSLLEYDSSASTPLATLHILNELSPAGGARTQTWSFDQSTGKLDTLNLYWDQSQALEVAALGVRKIY